MFPNNVHEALAISFVQSHDLKGLSAAEINDLYYKTLHALEADSRNRQVNVRPPMTPTP